ncbi:PREDICTED: uncharacterized protein LOC109581319 [Amphimedon queenslandica]|nr:PREDICTED: uncharacterized protein LOC109581319 [Amphimedon queenslandica]|eukprot:XP_019850904.1 PREDICTED: uncharacterized protein LOC109581319 [Amphimedon queenslandica]
MQPWAVFCIIIIIATCGSGENSCYEGDLRVDPGNGPILQFCSGGIWGYMCASNNIKQNKINADVACQQLGKKLSKGDITNVTSNTRLSPIYYYHFFACTGFETKLKECRTPVIYNTFNGRCRNDLYAAAVCEPAECRNGDLTVNKSRNQFPLQFCARGKWTLLCGIAHTWTRAQAKVACKQLGLNPIGAEPGVVSLYSRTVGVFNGRFHCRGNESSLLACSYSLMASPPCTTANPIAGVECGEWPKSVERIRMKWSSSILYIKWEHDAMNYYETTDKDEDDDIWYTVYCRSDSEIEEAWIQVTTTSAMVTGLSPLTNYTCCVELTEVPYIRETCLTITTGPLNISSQPNVTATPAAYGSSGSGDAVSVGAGSALSGVIVGILLASFVAILTACYCHWKKEKTKFNNEDYNSHHNNPGYSGLVRPEGFRVEQKSAEVVPLYDIIDRTVVDGPPNSAPTQYL